MEDMHADHPDRYTENPTEDELLAVDMGELEEPVKKSAADLMVEALDKARAAR